MHPRVLATLFVLAIGAAGVFAATAGAQPQSPGDGCLVVNKGFGKITLMLSRGIVFGRFQSGTLSYTDQDTTDNVTNLPKVPGVAFTKVNDHVWTYGPADTPTGVRFRSAGPTKLTVNAQSIDLSVAGKGKAVLSVAGFSQDIAGKFSVDDDSFCEDNFQKMPLSPTKFLISSPVAE
jgi:hypothetical protein